MSYIFILAMLVMGGSSAWAQEQTIFSFTVTSETTAVGTYSANNGTAVLSGSNMATDGTNVVTVAGNTYYKFNTTTTWTFNLSEGTYKVGDVITFTCASNSESKKTGKGVTISTTSPTDIKGDFEAGATNTLTYTIQSNDGIAGKNTFDIKRADSDIKFGTVVVTRTLTPKTVTFNAGTNGTCSIPSNTEASAGAGVTLPLVSPSSGYEFTGWFNLSDIRMGGATETYKPSENTTLYAHYAETTGVYKGAASGQVAFDTNDTKFTAVSIPSGKTWKFTFNNYGRPTYNGSFGEQWNNWTVKVGDYYFRADNWGWLYSEDVSNGTSGNFTGDWNKYMIALENGALVEVLVEFNGSQAIITGTTTYKGETFKVSATREMTGESIEAYITMQNAYLTNYQAQEYVKEITISTQPQSATYTQFVAATPLSVTATAPTGACTYQWQQEKNSAWENISNATSATYSPATTTVGITKYRCIVSAEGLDSKTTDEVTITVNGGNSEISNLVVMASGDVYTPSAAIPLKTLAFNNKIISAGGGNDYKAGFGLNFKDNRYIAFKVPAGATIIIEAGNHGNNGDREIWLGSDDSNNTNKQNLKTQVVAQGATGTLTYKYETGGVVYLSASYDLYLKKLTVTNGFQLTKDFNGHSSENIVTQNVTTLENPLPTPTADGYTFVGWYTDPNLTSAAVAGATLTGNTTLYAKWIINKGYIAPLNGNGITTTLDHIVIPQSEMSITLPSAYETAQDIDIPANEESNWWFASTISQNNRGLYKNTFREAYQISSVGTGNVLTQSKTGLESGKYEVILDVAASATNIRKENGGSIIRPTGNNLTQAFAGDATQFIPVINRTALDPEEDYDRVVLVTEVTNGTLTYGIKNVQASGNWYVCRVHSIKKIDDSNFTDWNTKADGTGTSYTAGASYKPNYNGTVLFAQWKKTYNFRPVAKNGTIQSITINSTPVPDPQNKNNQDIKVYENSTIVITVAPDSGYKFKNWSITGTTGEESNNGLTYTINQVKENTKATANFVVLGTATDPNPVNGTFDSANNTVTINPYPASYGGQTQDIDLGLPAGATFTITSGNATNVDGKLSVTAPTANNSTDITITVIAEDRTTQKDYTIRISTSTGSSYSYTVNAVDGSTVLETIASGDYAEGTGNITVYYPQHVLKDGKLYELTKESDSNGWYRKIFAPNSTGYEVNIEKSATVENVVYYTEAENLTGFTPATGGSLSTRSSMGTVARSGGRYSHACTLKKGTYKIFVRGDGDNSSRVARFKVNNEEVFTFNFTQLNTIGNKIIKVTEDNAEISVACEGSQASGIDWFYIQDLGVLPITEDGQEEYLIQTNCEANSYLTATIGDGTWESKTFDNVSGNYMKFVKTGSIALKFNGALAYEVFVNADASKKYKINGVEQTTGIKGIQSLMSKCPNNEDLTVTIAAGGNTVYPVKVKFYTKPLIVGAETSIKMGKGEQSTDLNVVGGTAQLVTTSAQASTYISNVSISDGKLYATPVKAGVAHLTINIVDGERNVLNTVDYIVNVVKQQVTMTYLHDGKDAYNATTDGAFVSPTVLIKDADGTVITATVNSVTPIIYISDDETLAKYNGTTAELIPNIQGVAKLKAVLYNNTIYENALATFVVNVSSGIDKKLYTMGTDSKGNPVKIGQQEPTINSTLVAEQDGKTMMTMIYGGYKYQDKLTNGYTYTDSKGVQHTVKDSWKGNDGKFSAYNGQGKDIYGQALDNQIDDFGFQVQAQQDSRDEYNKGIQWFTTSEVKSDDITHYTEYERIKPFSLPVKGAYLKFEAEVNGTLTAYVLQNGNVTFDNEEGHRDEPDPNDPLGTNPRVYYWFNQDGYRIDPISFTSKQPLTIGRDYNGELARQIQEWLDRSDLPELRKYLIDDNAWPTQAEVNANLQKPVPTPQTVVRYKNGYMVAQKAYVKYIIPVVAGDTYYFFSNDSKVGAAGFNFLPAEDGTVDIIHRDNNGQSTMPAVTNNGTKNLNCETDIATTHKTSTSIDMYKTATLPRKFKTNTWSTICLPFHVTETQVERVFGKGTNLVVYNGISTDGKARLQKHVNQDILAGQPYLIYPTGTGIDEASDGYIDGTDSQVDGLTFTNVNFTPNVAVQSYASNRDGNEGVDGYGTETPSFNFIGTLAKTTVNKYDYYINNNTGNLTRYTGNGTELMAYYAYLKNSDENSITPGAKIISGISYGSFEDDDADESTGIMEVMTEMGFEIRPVEGIYNLSGQKVGESTRNLPKGIYIINGQKVNIK